MDLKEIEKRYIGQFGGRKGNGGMMKKHYSFKKKEITLKIKITRSGRRCEP